MLYMTKTRQSHLIVPTAGRLHPNISLKYWRNYWDCKSHTCNRALKAASQYNGHSKGGAGETEEKAAASSEQVRNFMVFS